MVNIVNSLNINPYNYLNHLKMSTMKKLLPFIIILLFLGSCNPLIKQVDNPKQLTTLEVLENIDTTINYDISLIGDKAYLLNDNEVVYMLSQHDDDFVIIDGVILAILFLLIFFLGMGVGSLIP